MCVIVWTCVFHTHSPGSTPSAATATKEADCKGTTEFELEASEGYATQGSGAMYNHYSELAFCWRAIFSGIQAQIVTSTGSIVINWCRIFLSS